MKKTHTTGFFLFALPLLFTGVLSLHGTLFGKAAPSVSSSVQDTVAVAIIDSLASNTPGKGSSLSLPPNIQSVEEALLHPQRLPALPLEQIDAETLWLARCIFSETKRPEEQELVAWVVRNRVETRYRGKSSYEDVVLDPFQFSAFNPDSRIAQQYNRLSAQSKVPGWQRTISIAYYVRHAAPTYRPFSLKTRHFYSERSMIGRAHPEWVSGRKPVRPTRKSTIDERRFRFYEDIS